MALICNLSRYTSKFLNKFAYSGKKKPCCRIACGATARQNWSINPEPSEYQNKHLFRVDHKFPINYENKLEELRHLLMKPTLTQADPIESLILVDAIQRSGIGHHYRDEIHTILTHYYVKTPRDSSSSSTIHDVALSFRLLRQQGHHVSAVFNNFKGQDGKFRGEVRQDIAGLLELYEATQLGFEGENILVEAEDFSSKLLRKCAEEIEYSKWSRHINMRLKHPCHMTITRFTETNNFLVRSDLRGSAVNSWEKPLMKLARVELLMAKPIYQEELLQVHKWWDGLGLTKELKLARNQPLKWYTWSMTALINDIRLSKQRIELTKSIAFVYLIDDIFDLYGTPDELAIFTEAVDKWDYAAIDMLPEYMKMSYKALLDTTNKIARMIFEKHGHNPINTLKETWASLCKAFSVEAKWFAGGDLPRAEEYLANGKVSSGVHVVLVHLFYILGLSGTQNQGAILLEQNSTLISSVAAILRLSDDLGSAKDEQQNGKDGSYIEYYMRDNHGVSFKQAREHVINMIASEWKLLNKECFEINHYSPTLSFYREACLNLARMVPLMYSYDDNQRLPILEEYIDFMLLKPKSIKQIKN
ncbi:hypothetical protein ACP275_08G152500 [Erythranthe tilingii]